MYYEVSELFQYLRIFPFLKNRQTCFMITLYFSYFIIFSSFFIFLYLVKISYFKRNLKSRNFLIFFLRFEMTYLKSIAFYPFAGKIFLLKFYRITFINYIL